MLKGIDWVAYWEYTNRTQVETRIEARVTRMQEGLQLSLEAGEESV